MAGSNTPMVLGWLVALGLLVVCAGITSGDHPNANFKGTRYQKSNSEVQALGSDPASEVEYVDGPLAPLYDFLIQRRLQRFCKLLRDANLEETINGLGGSWTVFAPTDASFVFLPGGTLEQLQRNPELLRDFILHHFVLGDFPSSQIQNEILVDSVQGSPLRFNIYGQLLTVSGAQIVEPDLVFEMGRVHIIDHPLYPLPTMDIITYLQRNHRDLYRLIVDAGLVDYISSGTFTFLVPDDQAFSYLSVELKDALKTNASLAESILLNHILPGSIYTGGITDGMQWETVTSSPVIFTVKRGLIFVNDIPIVQPDIPLTNGVIHVVNRVLLPEGIEADCQCKPTSERGQVSGSFIPPAGQARPQSGQRTTTRRPGQSGSWQTPRPVGGQVPGSTGVSRQPGQSGSWQTPRPVGGQVPGSTGISRQPGQSGSWQTPRPVGGQVPGSTGVPGQPGQSGNWQTSRPVGGQVPGSTGVPGQPGHSGSWQTPRPVGGQVPGSPGVPRQPGQSGVQDRPQGPVTSPGQSGNRPWSPSRSGQPVQPVLPSTQPTQPPIEDDINSVIGTAVQPDIGRKRPDQTRTTRYPPLPPRPGTNPPSPNVGSQPQRDSIPGSEEVNYPEQEITPGIPQTTRQADRWANRQKTPTPRYPTPQRGTFTTSTTRRPQTTRTYDWNQPRVTQPSLDPLNEVTEKDISSGNQGSQTQRPAVPTSSWQQRNQITGTTRQPYQPPRQPAQPPQGRVTTPRPIFGRPIPSTIPPANEQPFESNRQQPNCRKQNERVTTSNQILPICSESTLEGCQSAPHDPTDPRPLCPDTSNQDCRDPNSPYNPSDNRPLCPSRVSSQNCREFGQPTYVGDRRPLCTPSTPQSGCKDPSAPYNPSDRRPVCRNTNVQDIPPPQPQGTDTSTGCRRPDEIANPQDRRPMCSEEPEEDCRPLLERPRPGDRRPVCKINKQTSVSKPTNDAEKPQKKPDKPQQQPTSAPRGQYPTQTTRRQSWQSTTRSPQSWQMTRQPAGKQPQPGSSKTASQPEENSFQTRPQTGSQQTQTGSYPLGPQSGRTPNQPQTGAGLSKPSTGVDIQPQVVPDPGTVNGVETPQPPSGSYPSQPQSGRQPSQPQTGRYPTQPPSQTQSGRYPSQQTNRYPSQQQSGRYPSQPQRGIQPSQPQTGSHPSSQPQSGSYPSDEQTGSHPSQPHTGSNPSQPQTGSYPSRPQTGYPPSSRPTNPLTPQTGSQQPGSPQDGSHPSQPQTGSYPSHVPGGPQSDSIPSQPNTGSRPIQRPGSPQSGRYPSQPQSGISPTGVQPSQPDSGSSGVSQPDSGQFQPGRPSYPQRRPGSQQPQSRFTTTTPQPQAQGVSRPGSNDGRWGQPVTPLGRPGATGQTTGPFAPRRPTTPTRVPISVTGTSTTPGEDSRRTLYEIVEDPALLIRGRPVQLTRIFELFHKAGIQDILNEPGPTTVFLPSDDAFALLPKGVVEQLEENPELLRQVLLFHVTKSEILPSSQQESYTVPSVEGNPLVITMLNSGRLIFVSGAKAVAVTRANNGIFYVINQLLYPLPHHDIVGAIQSRPDLSTLAYLLTLSGLEDMLRGQTPYTLLAPTDNAFAQLPQAAYDELTRNSTALQEILLNHIIEGAHYGREFFTGGTFPSVRGGKLKFQVVSYGYQVNEVNIKTPEIVTGSGVIHLVDQVLLEDPDLRFFTSLENAVVGDDGSLINPQQPSLGVQQPGRPVAGGFQPGTGNQPTAWTQPQTGGLQPARGQPAATGRLPASGPGSSSGSVAPSPIQPQRPSFGGPRQPSTGQPGQTGGPSIGGQATPGQAGGIFGGPRQPSTGGQATPGQTGGTFGGPGQPSTGGHATPGQTGGIFGGHRQPSTGGQATPGQTGGTFGGPRQPSTGGQASPGQTGGTFGGHRQPSTGGQAIPGQTGGTFGGPRQPSTGGQASPGQTGGAFGVLQQTSVHGSGQQTGSQPAQGHGRPGQSGHSTFGGQGVTTHGQRTQTTSFTSQRRPTNQIGGSLGNQNPGSFQTGGQATDVAELARNMGLNQFANWITNTGLLEKIHDGGVYTVFAPTDEAVGSLPQEMSYSIQSDPEQVKSLLQYHIVPQTLNLNSITNEETASTLLQGKTIRFNVYKNSQPDCRQLVTASGTPVGDALATMGSIQVIPVDHVLYQPSGNLMNIVEASPILQKLNDAVRTARLTWVLTGTGPMTVFAPSDAAFNSLTEEQRKTLIEDKQAFSDLLKRHIVRGTFFSSGIQEDLDKKSENNKPIQLSLREGILNVNSVPVTYSDITATNGVLHVIDHFL